MPPKADVGERCGVLLTQTVPLALALRDFESLVFVLSPDGATKAVFGCIGARDRIIEIVEFRKRQHRAKLFLLHDATVLRRIVEDRHGNELTGRLVGIAANQEVITVIPRIADQIALCINQEMHRRTSILVSIGTLRK